MTAELGALLVKAGKITQQQLAKALEIQKQTNGKLGQVLVQMGAVPDENEISEFVGRQLNIGA
ncbi:MAG TPA: type II secretion system protein GspE, partial [candidate division Zixibacteria bacterium]|nr:type II secretion system protein GspE [candidate division Zixibacteria bacterium]